MLDVRHAKIILSICDEVERSVLPSGILTDAEGFQYRMRETARLAFSAGREDAFSETDAVGSGDVKAAAS